MKAYTTSVHDSLVESYEEVVAKIKRVESMSTREFITRYTPLLQNQSSKPVECLKCGGVFIAYGGGVRCPSCGSRSCRVISRREYVARRRREVLRELKGKLFLIDYAMALRDKGHVGHVSTNAVGVRTSTWRLWYVDGYVYLEYKVFKPEYLREIPVLVEVFKKVAEKYSKDIVERFFIVVDKWRCRVSPYTMLMSGFDVGELFYSIELNPYTLDLRVLPGGLVLLDLKPYSLEEAVSNGRVLRTSSEVTVWVAGRKGYYKVCEARGLEIAGYGGEWIIRAGGRVVVVSKNRVDIEVAWPRIL